MSSNTKEISEILRNIQDLKVRLTGDLEIPKHQREKTERLIEGFKKELDLRETKINFYETCIHKLKGLLNGQILSKELKEKQKKLKLLREDHQEDMAKMEEMKSDMEFDHFYLDTIDNLSLRMLSSESLADAEQVQLELEEMTREIDEEV
ncbi:MAG: hypothetical protein GY705_04610 [Bacteroidetes bacterium]|nr:hypothetical protein [Bacteroidota bacterium]